MKLKQIEQPEVEPITLSEAKIHLRVTHDLEDDLIESLIQVARERCELISNRSYVQQKWRLSFDCWSDFPFDLPRPPLIEVEKIEYKDEDGDVSEWDSDNYIVDSESFVPKIYLADKYELPAFPSINLYPANAIQVTYTAEYEPDESGEETDYTANIPERYKHAIKLLIGEWYEFREEIVGTGAVPKSIPDGVKSLLGGDRVIPV
jgi:uncharacterized phiE125 gp8 family phage protein